VNKLWIRFFILAVYATMYVRDHSRPLLHEAMGLDSTTYDYEVFRITSQICRQVFPVEVDIDSPVFQACLVRLLALSRKNELAQAQGGVMGKLKTAGLAVQAALTFARLFLVPVKSQALPASVRCEPVW
jgi:magnesium-protoporphyrin IX monomethyl ester (oxidative) cyclase